MNNKITIINPLENRIPMEITSGKVFMPRYGPMILAGLLDEQGFDVIVYDENAGSAVDWTRVYDSGIVCFSLMSFCAPKGYEYIEKVRKHSRAQVIIGGFHASTMPEECLDHCDWLVRGEGDEALPGLISALVNNGDPFSIPGVSYRDSSGATIHNRKAPFIREIKHRVDTSLVAGYTKINAVRIFRDMRRNFVPRFNVLPVQASRGCPHNCSFCIVRRELGNVYRMRDPGDVIRDIAAGLERLKTNVVFFVDNDLTVEREYTRKLFEMLIDRFSGDLTLYFFARASFAHDTEMIELAKRTGDICIAAGFESINDSTLIQLKKGQTRDDVEKALDAFASQGVKVQALTIFGGEEDTVDTINETIDLYIRYGVYNIGVCCLYDFPLKSQGCGDPQMWPDHRYIHHDWRYYNGNFVIFFPRRMKPSVLQKEMSHAFKRFYRGQRNTVYQYHPSLSTARVYAAYLEEVEKEFYSAGGELLEERLEEAAGSRRMAGRVDLEPGGFAVLKEAGGFYFNNLFRPISWRFLFNLSSGG